MRLDVLTIFPEYLAPLELSLIGKARRDGRLDLRVRDLREFAHDRHRTVDDTPYGGGAGMVMKPEPWGEALDAVLAEAAAERGPGSGSGGDAAAGADAGGPRLIVPGPGGAPFTQADARRLAGEQHLVFACGRYEGIDERVYDEARERFGGRVEVVSLGDYVLNGGEVAVLAMVEAIARLLPGVVGNAESLVEESHEGGLLEYPVYTKPAIWRGRSVPAVLLSGDHGRIAAWRHEQRLVRTAERRPDLLPAHALAGLDGPGGLAEESGVGGMDGGGGPGGAVDDLTPVVATPSDVPELFTLTRACWVGEAHANGAVDLPPLLETLDDAAAALGEWTTWVVRSGGRLVASVRARRVAGGDAAGVGAAPGAPGASAAGASAAGGAGEGDAWEIGRLMVAPDLAGRGIGRALLAHAEAAAPADVRRYALVTGAGSERNLRMYRRAGYRPAPGAGEGMVRLTKRRR